MEGDQQTEAAGNPFLQSPVPGQSSGDSGNDRRVIDGPKVSLAELMSLVRHSKVSLIKEALDYLPSKKFDKSLVKVCLFYLFSIIWYVFKSIFMFNRTIILLIMALFMSTAMRVCLSILTRLTMTLAIQCCHWHVRMET